VVLRALQWLGCGLEFRRCGWCRALFYPHRGESMKYFLRRKYCHDGVCAGHGRTVTRWPDAARVALTLMLLISGFGALAHDPEAEFGLWYQSLRGPHDGLSCCSPQRDCMPVDDYRGSSEPGGYEALLDGEWVVVPPQAVLQRKDNPTGHAVLCVMRVDGKLIARCFVRASDS